MLFHVFIHALSAVYDIRQLALSAYRSSEHLLHNEWQVFYLQASHFLGECWPRIIMQELNYSAIAGILYFSLFRNYSKVSELLRPHQKVYNSLSYNIYLASRMILQKQRERFYNSQVQYLSTIFLPSLLSISFLPF